VYSGILFLDQYYIRTGRVALPFSHITLKTQKPLTSAYPETLKTFGNHLRKRRLDLNLLQKEMAQKLGVCEPSIYNWENNQVAIPAIKYIPKIIEFLGYVPFDTATLSIGEEIVIYRRLLGLSQKKLAHKLGIDPCTLSKWERNKRQPPEKFLDEIERSCLKKKTTRLYICILTKRINMYRYIACL
jgi:transcriptional regulator with XRE-family HTH domain